MMQALLSQRDRGDNDASIALPDSLPVGIAVIKADGSLRHCNGVWRHWLDPRHPVAALAADSDRPRLAAFIDAARQSLPDAPPGAPIEIHATDHRTAQIHATPGENGDVVICVIDATIRASLRTRTVQAQNQAQKMQAIGQLAGGIAHDFNNLLTAIGGFCDLLMQRPHAPSDMDDLRQIRRNTDRAAALVGQLLAFSRRQTLQPSVLSLAGAIADATRLLERLLGEAITLRQNHASDLWPIRADRHQLEQVIVNLAVNARDAMRGRGILSIRSRNITQPDPGDPDRAAMPPGDYVLCAVSDTGSGMPPATLARIFEPFFSSKPAGQGTGQGSGLGLATVHGIIKQTGGFIFAESREGHGTTFRVYLPRHKGEPESASQSPVAAPESVPASASGTILLVEDEESVRKVTARALSRRGYTVLEAGDGEQALDIITARKPPVNLIISDVVMPGMSGPDLIAELRRRGCAARVLLVSGYAADALHHKPLDPGAGFLTKPFTLTQLTDRVRQALESPRRAPYAPHTGDSAP